MVRNVIHIDEKKCVGCGLCAVACKEGAIGLADGKARLLREDHCDGLGNCLPVCPTGAISFEKREAGKLDMAAAKDKTAREVPAQRAESQLGHWPVQIRLAPKNAPYFDNADLLVAADCTAYAYANFHGDFMRNRITLIGCPKLDDTDYSEKLGAILEQNCIKSITVVRMEVPCCGGIERAVRTALANSGKSIPCNIVTISTDGTILED